MTIGVPADGLVEAGRWTAVVNQIPPDWRFASALAVFVLIMIASSLPLYRREVVSASLTMLSPWPRSLLDAPGRGIQARTKIWSGPVHTAEAKQDHEE